MAEPGRADLSADFTTNQVCQDSFHVFKSLEDQDGAAEPDVPRAQKYTGEAQAGPGEVADARDDSQLCSPQLS